MKAIETRSDIELLVKEFYAKVRMNDSLGPIFDDIIKINWDHHIPILIDFWETILLDHPIYRNNAMGVHFDVNEKVKLQKEHFTTWLSLFDATIDEYFEGEKAALAKRRAHDIANLMSFKMDEINKKN
jgi:hemoglobin